MLVFSNDSQTNSDKKDPNIDEEESSNDDLKPKQRDKKSGARKAAVKQDQAEENDHGTIFFIDCYREGKAIEIQLPSFCPYQNNTCPIDAQCSCLINCIIYQVISDTETRVLRLIALAHRATKLSFSLAQEL